MPAFRIGACPAALDLPAWTDNNRKSVSQTRRRQKANSAPTEKSHF